MTKYTANVIFDRLKRTTLITLLVLFSIGLAAPLYGGGQVKAEGTPWPSAPAAPICGNSAVLGGGPTTAPDGAVTVPAGNNENFDFQQANTTYWFAPGVHTLGTDIYSQIIPGDNASFIGAPGAILDGQNANRFAFTQQATNVTIKYLEVRNFGPGAGNNDEGVINHDAGANWTIEYNYVHDNDGAGVFLGTNSVVRYNCLKDNGQYGFSSYHPDGVTNVLLDSNEITGNNTDNWEALREGCGCTGGGKFWDTRGAVVTNNWVHDNRGTGLWADHNNADFLFENNYIENNDGIGIFYEVSYNFAIKNNVFKRNALVDGKSRADNDDSFPSAAIYISESGGDTRAGTRYAASEITGNLFEDNWDGVALWENADRFCRPGEEFDTTNGCPFFEETWGLRYKTQNITISENKFSVDRDAIECTNEYCARNALFSNYGTHPTNSPYLGDVIQQAITFDQNNKWLNNEYVGDWNFMPHDMGNQINFATWQASPYAQDAGSTYANDPGTPGQPPTTTPQNPPVVVDNDLDDDTATLEGSVGNWQSWYSANISRSNEAAHTGSHSLKVDITDPWGWGVELSNWPGFESGAGVKNISFWGKAGSGSNNIKPKMTVKWMSESGSMLQTDSVTLSDLTNTWQKVSAVVEAPVDTTHAWLYLSDGAAAGGSHFYLDDFVVGDAPNVIDAATAGGEGSAGSWQTWYSANVSATTEQANSGGGSLRIDVTDPWGWAVQLANWPGFETTAGDKRISFSAKQGTGTIADATVEVIWFDANQQSLRTDVLPLTLTGNWQQAVATVTAPAGTAYVYLNISSISGQAGDSLYLDDLSIISLN